MGYASGISNTGREIGYAVKATCDQEGCGREIDRGVAYCCGGVEGHGNAGVDGEPYCGGYFCAEHLRHLASVGEFEGGLDVCPACVARSAACPRCAAEGVVDDDDCPVCDGDCAVATRAGVPV